MSLKPQILAMIHDGHLSPPPQLPSDEEIDEFLAKREQQLQEAAAQQAE